MNVSPHRLNNWGSTLSVCFYQLLNSRSEILDCAEIGHKLHVCIFHRPSSQQTMMNMNFVIKITVSIGSKEKLVGEKRH